MKCTDCQRDNRPTARYCRHCGSRLKDAGPPLIGKGNLAALIDQAVDSASVVASRARAAGVSRRGRLSFAITGPAGCGKNFTADYIARRLADAGLVAGDPQPTVVKSADYQAFTENLDDRVKAIGGGVLIIDDAHKFCPEGRAEQVCELDRVVERCPQWCDDPTKPVVILLGSEALEDYFDANPDSAAMIQHHIALPSPGADDLRAITRAHLTAMGYRLTPEADAKIGRVLAASRRRRSDRFDRGHEAFRIAYGVMSNPAATPGSDVTPDMIRGEEFVPKTVEEVLAEFDRYVGVDDVKAAAEAVARAAADARARGIEPSRVVNSHYVFTGNPGTGKTTMARLFADVLQATGVLPGGQLVEVDRGRLVGEYVGKTPKLVRKAVDDAMGGVLFIDEAYALCSGKDDHYGREAVDTLLKDCEDRRGQFVCLLAGYPEEMQRFMGSNPGLERRFDRTVAFRDYTGPELAEIFRRMVAADPEGLSISPDLEAAIPAYFDKMYLTRSRRFGNAGTVRNLLGTAKERMRRRGGAADGILTAADLRDDDSRQGVDDILASLDDLVGMAGVKSQIASIAKSARMQQRLAELGVTAASPDNIHIIITGNPGTGKTTVARRLGAVFKAIGILPTDKVVIKNPDDIFDSYVKSAGRNMTAAVDDAMGGVLFIDEAYNLMPLGRVDQQGAEAVGALMVAMSERQGQFVTVLAGYPDEMQAFISQANPGFERRFTHRIHIPDYTPAELLEIFVRHVDRSGMRLSPEARALASERLADIYAARDSRFGNAAVAVKLFDTLKANHFSRLDPSDPVDVLLTITPDDF